MISAPWVNPMIVAGQLHGGVAQGIGQALMEEVSYDSSGQPITGSFMDYALTARGGHPADGSRRPSLARKIQSAWAPKAAAKAAAPEACLHRQRR